ncbi:MAG: acyl-CoA thioesterase [Verrucomicrobiota bacterium]
METHRLVLPEHLNQYGYLFGGYLLMWVDEAAWMAASLAYPDCRFVTVGMDQVSFRKSVREGSILQFHTEVAHRGTTSVGISVSVRRKDEEIFSTSVTFVRVDKHGEKESLPKN